MDIARSDRTKEASLPKPLSQSHDACTQRRGFKRKSNFVLPSHFIFATTALIAKHIALYTNLTPIFHPAMSQATTLSHILALITSLSSHTSSG